MKRDPLFPDLLANDRVDRRASANSAQSPARYNRSVCLTWVLDAMGRGEAMAPSSLQRMMERPMPQLNDLSRSLVVLKQDTTLIAVIEMGQSSWLVAGVVPGIERQPLKKLTADQDGLLQLPYRWRNEAVQAGRTIKRIAVA
jgi:hypothetical protein